MKDARVVFFGTPDLAVPTVERLIQQTTLVACVTQIDKPKGRSKQPSPSPVKVCAKKYGIPVLQPRTLKLEKTSGAEFYDSFVALQPDVAVVFAYGKIIPEEYLRVPPFGFLNIHPSLLPQLRGPSPINYAILNGLERSGVTIMKLDAGMDTGPLLVSTAFDLSATETAVTLHDKVQQIAADLMLQVMPEYLAGRVQLHSQDNVCATYSQLLKKEDGEIDWSKGSSLIERQIRALNPWPGVYCICEGRRVKILEAHLENGRLIVDRVQPEGKRPMAYVDFLHGNGRCQFPPIDAA